MAHSNGHAGRQKPYPDFPLGLRADGRWQKRIRGKLYYFTGDAQEALAKYKDVSDDLHAGRRPRRKDGGLTVRDLCNQFLDAKKRRVDSGELAAITWQGYLITCRRLAKHLGDCLVDDLRPEDFDHYRAELAKTNGLVGLKDHVLRSRMVFTFAQKQGLVDRAVNFGASFSKPPQKAIRKARTPRMYEPAELRQMIEAADPVTRAGIYLGLNAGFSCTDVGRLPTSAIAGEWLVYPRTKTGTTRRIPLWPETQAAIAEAIRLRPKPATPDFDALVFLRRNGTPFVDDVKERFTCRFTWFLHRVGLHRPRHGFYTLRHVLETIGGESRDQVAVDSIMGHERGDMASEYRERISDERLRAVVDTVREWLFTEPAADGEPKTIKFQRKRIG